MATIFSTLGKAAGWIADEELTQFIAMINFALLLLFLYRWIDRRRRRGTTTKRGREDQNKRRPDHSAIPYRRRRFGASAMPSLQ